MAWHVPWLCEANYIDAQAMIATRRLAAPRRLPHRRRAGLRLGGLGTVAPDRRRRRARRARRPDARPLPHPGGVDAQHDEPRRRPHDRHLTRRCIPVCRGRSASSRTRSTHRSRSSRPPLRCPSMSSASELIARRELLWNLTLRELRGRYKRSMLGWGWSLLNPIAFMLVYTFAFSLILRATPQPGDPSGLSSYAFFLLCGLLPWSFFNVSVTMRWTASSATARSSARWPSRANTWSSRPSWPACSRWRSSSPCCRWRSASPATSWSSGSR